MNTYSYFQAERNPLPAGPARIHGCRVFQMSAFSKSQNGTRGMPGQLGLKRPLAMAIVIWGVLIHLTLHSVAEADSADASAGRWSPWSDIQEDLQIRIFAPMEMTYDIMSGVNYSAVCEVRNTGSESKPLFRRGRIYTTDAEGREWSSYRMMNYESRVAPNVLLPPGGSVRWRQEGIADGGPREGAMGIAVELDKPRLRSPALPVELRREGPAEGATQEELRMELERQAATVSFRLPPSESAPVFRALKSSDQLIHVKGKWYYGVKCRVPAGADRLRFAYGPDLMGALNIHMMAANAKQPEVHFYSDMRTDMKTGVLKEPVEGIGNTGDCFRLVDFTLLSGFEPGAEIWIGWRVQDDVEADVAYLIHFIDQEALDMNGYFDELLNGKMFITR